ncbi:presqualene diphosphate synthase HpnD [Uliginosibacterium gangwonense]|uniref:presqualene diphosphate synthase HpnD n=1 Tax=Uliginosibacterium gangwonense TaxID=392736 RepID=UPI00039BB667|nr:presqualene diphosphate synthase HpnD [Uliginosibacterium gangwonense]
MTPDDYCQQKAAMPGSSLYYSLVFLPQEQRTAIAAVHAFLRELESVVADTHDPQLAERKLEWWESQLDSVFSGLPEHPVGKALAQAIHTFDLPQELFSEMIDGTSMDLQQGRYLDFKNLQLYCYRVSGTVCLLMSEICSYTDRATQKFAHDLGVALKLAELLVNVGADARQGRIYLPVDELQQYNVPAAEILDSHGSENFDRLMTFQIQRTQALFSQALSHLQAADRKTQRTSLILAAIQQAMLHEIHFAPRQVLTHKISLTPLRKLWIATRVWLKP